MSFLGARTKHRRTLISKQNKLKPFTNNPGNVKRAWNVSASPTGTASESPQENPSPPPPSHSLFLGREGKTILQQPPVLSVEGYIVRGWVIICPALPGLCVKTTIGSNTQERALAHFPASHYPGTLRLDVELGNLKGGRARGGREGRLLSRYHLLLGSSRTPSLNLTSASLDSLR